MRPFFWRFKMKKLFIAVCKKITGKSEDELVKKWGVYYFLTRSKSKAYYHTLFS